VTEPVYLVCDEYDDKAKFVVQRLGRFHDNIEVIDGRTLWKLDGLQGVYVVVLDPDEMEPDLLDEVVNRINMTYDASRTMVSMMSVQYGVH
jgi:hypothetical protein